MPTQPSCTLECCIISSQVLLRECSSKAFLRAKWQGSRGCGRYTRSGQCWPMAMAVDLISTRLMYKYCRLRFGNSTFAHHYRAHSESISALKDLRNSIKFVSHIRFTIIILQRRTDTAGTPTSATAFLVCFKNSGWRSVYMTTARKSDLNVRFLIGILRWSSGITHSG